MFFSWLFVVTNCGQVDSPELTLLQRDIETHLYKPNQTSYCAPFPTIPTTRHYSCTALSLYCRYNPLTVGPSLYCFTVLLSMKDQNRTPGRTLEQFLTTSLFEPLSMCDTSFSVPDEKLHRFAACYGNASTWGRLYGSISGKAPKVSRNGLIRLDGDCPEDSAWRRGQDCKIQLHLFASKCFVILFSGKQPMRVQV